MNRLIAVFLTLTVPLWIIPYVIVGLIHIVYSSLLEEVETWREDEQV